MKTYAPVLVPPEERLASVVPLADRVAPLPDALPEFVDCERDELLTTDVLLTRPTYFSIVLPLTLRGDEVSE